MSIGMMPEISRRNRGRTWSGNRRSDSPEAQADKARREEIVAQARQTDLVQLVGRYSQLRRQGPHEWAGPCPKCGGEDRLRVSPTGWFCRQCKPYEESKGWYGPIDFVMWITGLDFRAAVGWLTGAQMTTTVTQRAPVEATRPAAPERTEPTDAWRAEAEAIVAAAQRSLMEQPGSAGAEYLERRGLEPGTWAAFGWGCGEHNGRPAIVMPWYRAGRLMAIRYRYLTPTPDGQRLVSRYGSKFGGVLYGGQALEPGIEDHKTLVLCEGEINAASIWQVAHDSRLDVLSVGSESTKLTDAMIAHAAKYRHIIVWMDRREVAAATREKLPARAVGVSSPLRPGPDGAERKWDANDLLRIGKLGAFLFAVRLKCCGDDAGAREGLLWDICDMARLPNGIDPATGAAAWKLAGELGKPVSMVQCPDGAWRVGV
jgi:phage/plasmid primase-like uncharacterized protein